MVINFNIDIFSFILSLYLYSYNLKFNSDKNDENPILNSESTIEISSLI